MAQTAMHKFIEDNFYIDSYGEYMLKWTEDTPMTDVLNEALEKEKEQIMEAFDYGDYCIDLPDGTWEQKYKSPEEYYNQTYNQNK